MEQWEIDLRSRLDKELEHGCYNISTDIIMMCTGKGGAIEYYVALEKAIRNYNYEEDKDNK